MRDVAELTALYRDHRHWLEGWLRFRLGNPDDAADLTHDTYLRLIRSGRFPGPENARPFLRQIAKGLVIDLSRRRVLERSYLEYLAHLPETTAPSPEAKEVVMDTLVRVDRSLDGQPAVVRQVFLMARFDGLAYGQIAERLGIGYSTVRKYLMKATLGCLAALDGDPP